MKKAVASLLTRNEHAFPMMGRYFHTVSSHYAGMKDLFASNPKHALTLYFKNPNTFDATFLIGRREVSFGDAFKIYKTVESQQSIQVLSEMVLSCHRNGEQELCGSLFNNVFLPLLNSYSNKEFESLKEYSWNRIFACLLVFKLQNQLTFFYRILISRCPHIKLNEGNQRQLLNLFSSFGESDLALSVLESANNPTLIDYTMVLKSLATNGRMKEAILLLKKMENAKIYSDAIVFISLLKSCIEKSLQKEGLELIEMLNEKRLSSDILNTTIINFYFHFGKCQDALSFFEKQTSIDNITYGCIIQGMAKNGKIEESIRMLQSMIEKKLNPDHVTFSCLLKKCEENKLIKEGKFLHGLLRKTSIEHVSIQNSLISFYAHCGDVQESLDIFKQMKSHNQSSWNFILQALTSNGRIDEAFTFYEKMKARSAPDIVTFIILLKACANNGLIQYGQCVHSDAIKFGFSNDKQLMTSLVVFYSKCGDSKKALELFESIKSSTNIVAWNAIIQLLITQKRVDEAIDMLEELKTYNLESDALIYAAILRACADCSKFKEGLAIHKMVEQRGLVDGNLQASLLQFYGKKGDTDMCRNIFHNMKESNMANLPAYTSIIYTLVSHKQIDEALSLFNEMTDVEPDTILFSILLKACGDHSKHTEGRNIHKIVIDSGCKLDTTLAAALVYFYCKTDKETAFKLFKDFKHSGKSNTLMWNSIIQLLLSEGRMEEAIECFCQYSKFDIKPDNITFTTILNACAEKHELGKGKIIHNYMKDNNISGDVMLDRALINMYSKCGELEMAQFVFLNVIERKKEVNSFIFNAMLFAYAEHGKADECFKTFSDMIGASIQPTPETFTALLTACSHCNMHAKALSIYNSMEKVFKIQQSDIHKSCVVDALSRAGHLQEALEVIGERKEKVMWVTLMGACRKHNNIEIAEKAFDVLVDIDPTDGSFYVLLCNIYMFNGETEKANNIRELMKQNNAAKVVGVTSVYIGDEIHTFTSDDKKHADNHLIQKELDKLISELIEAGYNPDTRWVTRTEPLTEEQKRNLLCRHSEKIAMAYAFVRMPGTPKITLFKNLRVCGDCHEATKFISKVRKCTIVVRDASRYHHFEDGKCSCGGHW